MSEDQTLDDELGAIWDAADEPAAEPAVEHEVSDGRERDEHGRFKAKEEEPATPDEEGAEQDLQAEPSAEGAEEPGEPGLEPPASWSGAAKANWTSLTPDLQQEILKREQDWQKADTERTSRLKAIEPLESALGQVRQALALDGVEPATYVSRLVAADQFLREKPVEALNWIAQSYGIDLSQLNQQQPEIDPAVAPLHSEIENLKRQLTGFTQSQQAAQEAQVQNVVTQFMADPANEYAERLEDQILAEIPAVKAQNPNAPATEILKRAYDRAVRLDDGIQAELAAKQSAEAEAKRQKEAAERKAKADKLKASNLSSVGTSGGAAPPSYPNMDAELSAIYDQVQGAA